MFFYIEVFISYRSSSVRQWSLWTLHHWKMGWIFFLERYAPAEAIWSLYIFYRNSDLICFRQNWFLLPLLPYTGPAPSACYFLVWLTENVFFGDICDATENSVSLPQSPSSGNFLPWAIGHIVQPWLQENLSHGSEQEAALKSRQKLSRAPFYQARL